MTAEGSMHRLDGLEPDNPLAFLALLGLLRAIEAADVSQDSTVPLRPRAAWDFSGGPLRPALHLPTPVATEALLDAVAAGLDRLAQDYDFAERQNLDYSAEDSRTLLQEVARTAGRSGRGRADLLSALMTDGALKNVSKATEPTVDPTPFCLLFGQGHQHFLARLAQVPRQATPPARGSRGAGPPISPQECLAQALFAPWRRDDPTVSFRWDPEEDVRYALMAGDPTDEAYKGHTQHGANRLAAVGLAVLTLAPETRRGRVRPAVVGGRTDESGFAFAWPIWRAPTTLRAICGLLNHPGLWEADGLRHLGVDYVYVTRRITVGKFMNFTRARVLVEE